MVFKSAAEGLENGETVKVCGFGTFVIKTKVARKGVKVYTINPIEVEVNSITTKGSQKLYLGQDDVDRLKNKKVLIVDDVISTGESLKALETLVEKAGGNIVGQAAVLAEGDAADRDDIFFLEKLPLFFK